MFTRKKDETDLRVKGKTYEEEYNTLLEFRSLENLFAWVHLG